MEKEFVPYEFAVKLKELGFEESCLAGFDDDGDLHILRVDFQSDIEGFCLAPTFSQAFRWFREKYQLEGEISKRHRWSANSPNPEETFYQWGIFDFTKGRKNYIIWLSGYDADKGEKACTSHEEAELACLDKLIEIVEGIKDIK